MAGQRSTLVRHPFVNNPRPYRNSIPSGPYPESNNMTQKPFDPKTLLEELTNDELSDPKRLREFEDQCRELYMRFREELLLPFLKEHRASYMHMEGVSTVMIYGLYKEFEAQLAEREFTEAEARDQAFTDFGSVVLTAMKPAMAEMAAEKGKS